MNRLPVMVLIVVMSSARSPSSIVKSTSPFGGVVSSGCCWTSVKDIVGGVVGPLGALVGSTAPALGGLPASAAWAAALAASAAACAAMAGAAADPTGAF